MYLFTVKEKLLTIYILLKLWKCVFSNIILFFRCQIFLVIFPATRSRESSSGVQPALSDRSFLIMQFGFGPVSCCLRSLIQHQPLHRTVRPAARCNKKRSNQRQMLFSEESWNFLHFIDYCLWWNMDVAVDQMIQVQPSCNLPLTLWLLLGSSYLAFIKGAVIF